MSPLVLPRLELWDGLECAGGSRLPIGGFPEPSALQTVDSTDNTPSCTFTLPLSDEAAALVDEFQVARLWRADDDFDEWPIAKVVKSRGLSGSVDVTCRPLLYRLGEVGWVSDPNLVPFDGMPSFDGGLTLTLGEIIQSLIIDDAEFQAALGFPLELGTIEPAVEITLDYSRATHLQLIRTGIQKVQTATRRIYELPPLRRIGTTAYAVDILAA